MGRISISVYVTLLCRFPLWSMTLQKMTPTLVFSRELGEASRKDHHSTADDEDAVQHRW